MNKYSYTIAFLIISLFSGCSPSINQISFDQLQPAVFSFPEQIKNVAVISTIPQSTIDNINLDNPQPVTANQKKVKEMLAKEIADNGYFDKVLICDSIIKKDSILNNIPSNTVSSLLEDFDADMLISLDKIDILVKRIPGAPFGYVFDLLQCITTPEIKYYIAKKSPMFYTEKSDTTYYSLLELNDARNMLNEACQNAIVKSINIILPHWKTNSRYYYKGGCYEMRDAQVALDENKWDDAFNLWKGIYDNRKGKLKNAAALNIAVYYEMKDDINEALLWLDKASNGINNDTEIYSIIDAYRKNLSIREKQLGKLKIQMNRFSLNN